MGIKCPKCQADNPDTLKFCGECGTQIIPLEEIPVTETIETPKEELTTGSTFAGRYQIIEELGKGGMGKVYKAQDTDLKEKVAIKLLRSEIAADKKTIERFRNELKFARKIRHKNVCQMYDLNREEGMHYITMEYVHGEDLKRLIRKMGQMSAGQVISIAMQVCEGMAEAHRLGVVHRDLKPQNIMIDEEGNARIMDFGIARSVKGKSITGAGVMIGSPEYMSPEQVEGKESDQRSDIYSLGVILYEMVTGRVPFEGDTPFTIGVKHKSEAPRNPKELNSQIPDDLSRAILRCMEKDKEQRYQSSRELRSELENIEKGVPTTEKIIPKRKSITSKEITVTFGLKKLLIPALVVVGLIVVAVVILLLFSPKETVAPLTEKPSIAVLPFVDLSPEKNQEYFCDGMTTEIIAKLFRLQGWKVSPRTAVMRYKNTEKDIKTIGLELDVTAILEGSVQKEKDDIRIIATLINATDSSQLWSDTFDQKLTSVFMIQDEIAEHIASVLLRKLTPKEKEQVQEKLTDNIEAYDLYLRGNDYFNRSFTEKDFRIALQMYEKAIDQDPMFTHAYAMLSIIHSRMYFYYYDRTEECLIKAKKALDKALQLKPEIPESLMAQGYYYYFGHLEYEKALDQFETALKLQPNNIELLGAVGFVKRRQGKLEQALSYLKKAYDLDPGSARFARHIGLTYRSMKHYDQAENYYDHTIAISPDIPSPYIDKARIYILRDGNTKKAKTILEEASQNYGFDFTLRLAKMDILEGEYQNALDKLSAATFEFRDGQTYVVTKAQQLAEIYGYMNETSLQQKNYEIARKILEARIQEQPDDDRLHSALGLVYAGQGRKEDAIREGKLATELLSVTKMAYGSGPRRVWDMARIYVMVGEYEHAIDQIDLLFTLPRMTSVHELRLGPIWKPLWGIPRFNKLIEEER